MNRLSHFVKLRGTLVACIVVITLAVCGPAYGAPSGFTLEQVMSSPFPDQIVAARSGERIAWVFD
ncbi:MAG: hypothetical protein ACRD37_10490, partial [Candidatus Acidiferrales bacterium]